MRLMQRRSATDSDTAHANLVALVHDFVSTFIQAQKPSLQAAHNAYAPPPTETIPIRSQLGQHGSVESSTSGATISMTPHLSHLTSNFGRTLMNYFFCRMRGDRRSVRGRFST